MEMLIVIAIMLLLVIATLPRIKYALDESKVRESSRQLNSYVAMAKSRASSTGRPCGIYLVSEKLGDPSAYPGVYQATQLYLAEIPPPYCGDVLEASATVFNDPTSVGYTTPRPLLAQQYNMMTGAELVRWRFDPSTCAPSLSMLVTVGEPFSIRFDHKGPRFPAYRAADGFVYITGPIIPPQSNGPTAGYQFEIIRTPRRIGAPLALPRGTAVDLTYSGFGNSGTDFSACGTPVNTPPGFVLVMFGPSGRVTNVVYQVYDTSPANQGSAIYPFRNVGIEAQGTIHFLVGRPEKVGLALAQSNLVDNNALWVSVGRLTGSVITTDNAYSEDPALYPVAQFPGGPTFLDYLTRAREYAITQDVRGGQ